MKESAFRRIACVLIAYVLVAWTVLQVAGWARPALALPVLFDTLLRGALAFGVPVAVVMAWHYPRIAQGVEVTELHSPKNSS